MDHFHRKPRRWKVDLDGWDLSAQKYAGFVVLYSEGTSLISSLQATSDLYEPELVAALWREIQTTNAKFFLDVGANIGLVSLAVLKKYADLRIEAFEPGQHQSRLFEATIRYNHLETRIRLHREALGDHNGETDFFVHASEHVSGDGFVDTGRAGSAKKVRVAVQRLDEWWKESGKPRIPVVKIDTEGAELLILKGAVQFLEICRPTLFLEIWPENLIHYPYESQDVLIWLSKHGYRLETLASETVDIASSRYYWGREDTFVARPVF